MDLTGDGATSLFWKASCLRNVMSKIHRKNKLKPPIQIPGFVKACYKHC